MIRVRMAPRRPGGVRVVLVPEGERRPGFGARPDEAAFVGGTWLVALGPDARRAGAVAGAHLSVRRATLDLRGHPPAVACDVLTGLCLRAWHYDRLRTAHDTRLRRVDVLADGHGLAKLWDDAQAALRGVALARTLVSEPSDTLTPAGFVRHMKKLHRAGVKLQVLKGRDLRRAGLGGLGAVGGGSPHKPRLLILRWPGKTDAPPLCLVGKGITFDTGGLCIKPAAGMEEMRADMAGAAACAGAVYAAALRRSPAAITAVLPLAENTTGGSSYRPSDVLAMGCGRTVEVVDTDAEGRLVLADALGWAIRHVEPAAIVDLATLTGSIVVALGGEMAGLFDNDPGLAAHVAAAGQAVGEPVWRMPIGDGHRADLLSDIADLRHCVPGRGQPDACHAAAFLREFVGGTPWVHLDIAGSEHRPKAEFPFAAGATGFGVRLLDRLVSQCFEDPHR